MLGHLIDLLSLSNLSSLFSLSSLSSLSGLSGLVSPAISFPSPPGWQAYVSLLEHTLDFLARTFNSAGLAVIAFTIIVKTILLPLTITSIRSSKAMQELQPKIKELQKKHGKDRARISQETMKLYQTHRVNPMAGCLPMLIQIPIFFGVYRAIDNLSNGRGFDGHSDIWAGNFLWLNSLSDADPYKVLPIAAGVFQFVQTKMMRPAGQGKITDPQQAMMNQIMNFMPITVVLFGWSFASGPVIYWVTQSVYSVIQQWFITGWGSMRDWVPGLPELPEHQRLGYRAPRDLDDVVVMSGGDLPKQGGVMGWFNSKMQEAQEQQAARAAQRQGKSPSEIQNKVDQATAEPRVKQPRPVKKEARPKRERPIETNPAAASASSTNGRAASNGAAGPGMVPRKSRPTRKPDAPPE